METKSAAPVYSGGEFIRTAAGATKDILTILLDPELKYTEEQVSDLLQRFLEMEAKA